MNRSIELEKYTLKKGEPFSFNHGQVGLATLEIGGKAIPHLQTLDFPVSDPWSLHLRRSIAGLRARRVFNGTSVTELGIGDGRNIREVGSSVAGILGVDIERWRVEVAALNLADYAAKLPIELWVGDAISYLQELKGTGENVSGWAIMCLPQSPEGINLADRYDGASNLSAYRTDWEIAGLTLNAAVLDYLRQVADQTLRALIILSDRIPEEIKHSLFVRTGWEVEQATRTPEPIQQDPDTGIAWVSRVDDGRRFFERIDGYFEPVTAFDAEQRRKVSLESGLGREVLNLYHHLTVYQLRPK